MLDGAFQQHTRTLFLLFLQQPRGQLGQTGIHEPVDFTKAVFDFKFLRKIGRKLFERCRDGIQQVLLG